MKALMDSTAEYDILVIGGGATGAGVLLEAASRGLKCALVDSNDFASGTSSRSTKMAHGGLRYLENMMMLKGDPFENYELLKETLHERNYFIHAVPFLNKQLQLLIPCDSQILNNLYYYPGALLYHLIYKLQGKGDYDIKSIDFPNIMKPKQILSKFRNTTQIEASIYGVNLNEVQMNDSRMNLLVLLTSTIDSYIPGMRGANIANYTEVQSLIKNENGKIIGVIMKDRISGKEFEVKSKVVVNCTGIFADKLRKLDNTDAGTRIIGARGTHLILSKEALNIPNNSGIILPKTKDGRLLFIINYLGYSMVGTTDDQCEISDEIKPEQNDIDFILSELKDAFGSDDFDYQSHIISSWAGIRPLVIETEDDKKQQEENSWKQAIKNQVISFGQYIHGNSNNSTAVLSRKHIIETSQSGLVSVMGGKWTSFRSMGQETVDQIINNPLKDCTNLNKDSQTSLFSLIGSYAAQSSIFPSYHDYQNTEDQLVFEYKITRESAEHLVNNYGTNALKVAQLGKQRKLNMKLCDDLPFLYSEILYSLRYEMAMKPNDIICRRVPIAFINQKNAIEILPKIVDIMGQEFGWNDSQKSIELSQALHSLQYMK